MLEQLKEALEEVSFEREVAASTSYEEQIRAEIAEAEARIREKYEGIKAEAVLDLDYQIKALNKLIDKEMAKVAEAANFSTQ